MHGRGGCLPNTTVLARKHRVLRMHALHLSKLSAFDTSVLRDMTAGHVHDLSCIEKALDGCYLVKP
eukprot:5242153-Karenia_brevis.AAC.1